jgi:deoxyribose-phosphate aldolase
MLQLEQFIDYSLLRTEMTNDQVVTLVETALAYNFATVCVPPVYVPLVAEKLTSSTVKTCCVIGFPLGLQTLNIKLAEAIEAMEAGATEIDYMLNLSNFKSNKLNLVTQEIRSLRNLTNNSGTKLKIILETGLLSLKELDILCELAAIEKVDFIKTSTGYVRPGAEIEKVRYMRKILPSSVKIKAAGGIRTAEQAINFLNAGAERIGTSSVIKHPEGIELQLKIK